MHFNKVPDYCIFQIQRLQFSSQKSAVCSLFNHICNYTRNHFCIFDFTNFKNFTFYNKVQNVGTSMKVRSDHYVYRPFCGPGIAVGLLFVCVRMITAKWNDMRHDGMMVIFIGQSSRSQQRKHCFCG